MICTRCKKRPAVVFMTRIEGDVTKNEGLCLVCAKELGLKPVDDLMKRFGLGDDELEMLSDQMLGSDLGFNQNQENDTPGFEQGGTPVFPQFFMGGGSAAQPKPRNEGQRGKRRDKHP